MVNQDGGDKEMKDNNDTNGTNIPHDAQHSQLVTTHQQDKNDTP